MTLQGGRRKGREMTGRDIALQCLGALLRVHRAVALQRLDG